MNGEANIPSGFGDDDALAAEYVLGVLDGVERVRVAARIEQDPAFARLVEGWELHFAGLNAEFPEVPPPRSVKAALDRRLFAEASAPSSAVSGGLWASLAFWRAISAAALAAIAVLAFVTFRAPTGGREEGERLVALLAPNKTDNQFVALYDPARRNLRITRVAGDKPTGRDFELWLISGTNPPVSLGLVGATGTHAPAVPPSLATKFAEGATLAVTDEPAGGSPTGGPTGPVVALGPVKKF